MNIYVISGSLSEDADNLYMYVTNDGNTYKVSYSPLIRKLLKSLMIGKYDDKSALKGFINLALYGAKRYSQELKAPFFNKKVRTEVAKEYLEDFKEILEGGDLNFAIKDVAPANIKKDAKALKELQKQMETSIKNKRNIIKEITDKMENKTKGYVIDDILTLYRKDKKLAIKAATALGMKIKVVAGKRVESEKPDIKQSINLVLDRIKRKLEHNAKAMENNEWTTPEHVEAAVSYYFDKKKISPKAEKLLKQMLKSMGWYKMDTY